ncbi:hypothetical protein BS78_03G238600 [Paspalum vaginatum]|nr:hypothetical protein BS78_03G238600 [Paspalum vaginatum]
MKPYAMQLLLLASAVLAALCCATVCRASRTAPPRCDPLALRPCVPAVVWGAAPSAECCASLREQRPCLCRYSKNPELGRYIRSRDGRRIARACGVRVRGLRC